MSNQTTGTPIDPEREMSRILGPDGNPISSGAMNNKFIHGSDRGGINVPPLKDYFKPLAKLIDKSSWSTLVSNAAMVASNYGPIRQL